MKAALRDLFIVLVAVSEMVLLVGNAKAIDMPAREHVQSLVRMVEYLTIFTVLAVILFVWLMIKRDYKNKKSKQDDHKTD
ncbi:MAG: hypothetical protein WA435_05405 [Gallionellaceae bacterium]